jgi:hypothetical protein
MGKSNAESSLPGFVRLAPSIYVQDDQLSAGRHQVSPEPYLSSQSSFNLPPESAANVGARGRDTAPPNLIVITSWTGAAAKHVAKYTAAYNAVYPGVPILVITTVLLDLTFHSTKRKLKALAPAVNYLLFRHPPTLLLHAFSEGGAHKAVLLARAYLLGTHNRHRLPLSALILDSTPGRPSFSRASTAFARALPVSQSNPLVSKVLAPPIAKVVVGSIMAGQYLRSSVHGGGGGSGKGDGAKKKGGRSFMEETRRALNDDTLWDVRGMARTYLFGEGDEVVWWRDVQEHAIESAAGEKDGAEPGVGSLVVRFKRTEHCAHAKGVVNGAVYWAAVRKTWDMRADGGLGFRMGLGRRLSLDSLCCSGDDAGGCDVGDRTTL